MRALFVVLATVLLVAVIVSQIGSSSAVRSAPPLPLRTLAGAPKTIASLRGRPALVVFFASWCGPCVGEAPVIARAQSILGRRATVVAIDWSDRRHDAIAFVRRFGWRFTVLEDPDGTAGYAYGIQGLPAAFVLNSRGQIVSRLLGPQPASRLVEALRAAGRPRPA